MSDLFFPPNLPKLNSFEEIISAPLCCATLLPLGEASFPGPICSFPLPKPTHRHTMKCNGIKDELLPDVGNNSHIGFVYRRRQACVLMCIFACVCVVWLGQQTRCIFSFELSAHSGNCARVVLLHLYPPCWPACHFVSCEASLLPLLLLDLRCKKTHWQHSDMDRQLNVECTAAFLWLLQETVALQTVLFGKRAAPLV